MNRAPDNPLDAMAALERRYDGPVPETLRRAALAGGAGRLAASDAISRSALLDRLARHARGALARRRQAGGDLRAIAFCPAASDLRRYRHAGVTLSAEREPPPLD